MSEQNKKLQRLLDRQDIGDVLIAYCRCIDRLDGTLFRSIFWEDGGYVTNSNKFICAGDPEFQNTILQGLMKGTYVQSQHLIGNVRVVFESDSVAHTETYLHAFHRTYLTQESLEAAVGKTHAATNGISPDHAQDVFVSGRYLDRFEKRDDTWRIKTRRLVSDWTSTAPSTEWGGNPDSSVGSFCWPGSRGTVDPSYKPT